MRVKNEWMLPSRFWNEKNFWSGLSTKNLLKLLPNFALKKLWVCSCTKSVLQYSQGIVQMKWGLEWECTHPSRFWNRTTFWSGLSTKKVFMSLSNFARKKMSVCSITKGIFQSSQGLVQMKWGLKTSACFPVSSEMKRIFDLDCLRKTYLSCCQTLRSKNCRYAVARKVFFNLVKELFKWNEGLSGSVCNLAGS